MPQKNPQPTGPKKAQPQGAKAPPVQPALTPVKAAPQSAPAEPPELAELKQASAGLLYPSESDTPFDAFVWAAAGAQGQTARDQVAAHAKAGAKVEQVPVGQFFDALAGADDAERFKQLRQVLESRLSELGVFRAEGGAAEVDIYLVGKARSGDWVGLHTVSVET